MFLRSRLRNAHFHRRVPRFEELEPRQLMTAVPNWSVAFASGSSDQSTPLTYDSPRDLVHVEASAQLLTFQGDDGGSVESEVVFSLEPQKLVATSSGLIYAVALDPNDNYQAYLMKADSTQPSSMFTVAVPDLRFPDGRGPGSPAALAIHELSSGEIDVFIAQGEFPLVKFHDEGTAESEPVLDWTYPLQEIGFLHIEGLSVYPQDGSVYVAGMVGGPISSEQTSFRVNGELVTLDNAGWTDAFVAKLKTDGTSATNELAWVNRVGYGPWVDAATALAVGSNGELFVTGRFAGTATFGTTVFNEDLSQAGSFGGFAARLDPGNGAVQWARHFKSVGAAPQNPNDPLTGRLTMADIVTSNNRVLVSGRFDGVADLDPTEGNFIVSSPGDTDGFIAALNEGGGFQAAWHVNATLGSSAPTLAADGAGGVYAAGRFSGDVNLVTQHVFADQNLDRYLLHLHPDNLVVSAPAAPTNLFAAIIGTSVKLTWTDNSDGEDGFEIWRVAKPKGNATPNWGAARLVGDVESNVTTHTDENVSGSFYYRVRAYTLVDGERIYSDFSNEILVTVGGGGGKKK